MLKKRNRVPQQAFKNAYSKTHTEFFSLLSNKNNLLNSRVAVVVSKKVDQKATVRNKMKRIIREVFRELMPKIKPGYDMIVIAKKQLKAKTLSETRKLIEASLQKESIV